ncbi:MAG: mandelate racemase/muconate lactonizing enzyme family protein [Chloroflexota bacterium]|nr:mandelate racemase/muconate lactonizing enzyme family protein [Chloroflexota bacterium]
MKITAIHDHVLPIRSDIRNAFIDFSQMTASIVGIQSDVIRAGAPLIGYGFNSNGRYSQSGILRDRIIPRLLAAQPEALLNDEGDNFDPARAWDIMMRNEKPGGHGERSVAVGVVDMALWDLVAKIEGVPLYRLLGERYRGGAVDDDVFVYAAGGYYYPGKDLAALQEEIKSYLDLGYNTVKIKIGGAPLAEDLKRIEAVIEVVGGGKRLAVDANGRFDLKEALAYAEALEPYDLFWYEEPGDPLDYLLNAALASATRLPLATGENLFSTIDAANLIRYGGMRPDKDFLQMDPALSYGLVEYLRTLDMLRDYGWSPRRCIPHGGHQFALHIAAGLGLFGNESYPHVFQPFGGFGDDIAVRDGRIQPPQAPGIGFELKADLMREFDALF